MNEHTPGPWTIESSNSERWSQIIRPNNGRWPYDNVAYIEEMYDEQCTKKGAHIANAKLIAAAPDLLEALQAYLEAFENHGITNTTNLDSIGHIAELAYAAIDKATGVTNANR